MRKAGIRALAVCGSLVLALSACAGDDADGPDAADEGAREPQPGGKITYGMFGEINGFDPLTTLDLPSHGGSAPVAIYDTLMRLDDNEEVVPNLAKSFTTEDEGRTWTLQLREDVRFHDGTKLDANAVVFNVERHMDPDNQSHAASQVALIDTVEAVDGLTVRFELEQPWGAFPSIFVGRPGYIASPTAVEKHGDDYRANPVGAGPFRFVEWVPDDHFLLERNEDYWRSDQPLLDRIEYRPIPDTDSRLTSVQTGEIDITYFITAQELFEAEEHPDVDVTMGQGQGAETISFNLTEPPFNDLRARQAVAYATNYEGLGRVRFGPDADVGRAYSLFAPKLGWHVTDYTDEYPDYDLDRAHQLVQEYEQAHGEPLAFTHLAQNTPDRIEYAEALQDMWSQAGMEVELEFVDSAEFVQRLNDMDYQVVPRILPHFADPDPYLWNEFHGDSPQNSYGWDNPTANEALEEGRVLLEMEERREAYDVVMREMVKDLPFVMYGRTVQGLVHNPNLHGIDHHLDMTLHPHEMWIDD